MATLSEKQIAQQVQANIEAAEKTNTPVAFLRNADGAELKLTKASALDALAGWKSLLATKPDGTDRPQSSLSVTQLHVIEELIAEVSAGSQEAKLVDLDRELVGRVQAISQAITDKKNRVAQMKQFKERSEVLHREFGLID